LVAIAILVVGASLVYSAPRSTRVSKETRIGVAPQEDEVGRVADAVTPEPEVGEDWRVTAALQEDGSWAIAGVVGFSKDLLGRNVIEVKKDGDFETDTVLHLFVQLVELDTGEVVAGGIVSVKNNGDTVTLTVREAAPLNGKAKAGRAKVDENVPSAADGCEGGMQNGKFVCIRHVNVCSTDCDDITVDGITLCECQKKEGI